MGACCLTPWETESAVSANDLRTPSLTARRLGFLILSLPLVLAFAFANPGPYEPVTTTVCLKENKRLAVGFFVDPHAKPPLYFGYLGTIQARWFIDPHPSGATLEALLWFTRTNETAAKTRKALIADYKRHSGGKLPPSWYALLRRNVVLYWNAQPSLTQQRLIDRCLARSVG